MKTSGLGMLIRGGLVIILGGGYSWAEGPLGVCEALRSLPRHRGKFVEMRGVLVRGRHGWHLEDQVHRKKTPCSGLEKTNWPSHISVASPEGAEDEAPPMSFQAVDETVWATLKVFDKDSRHKPKLLVTVIGQLQAQHEIVVQRNKDGSYVGDGYAQMGQYPAQLIISTLRDVSLWHEQ